MRIVIVTAMWKRPEVFKMFATGVKRLQEHSKHEIIVVVIGSEGLASQLLCKKYGFRYTHMANRPLGKKLNMRLQMAQKLKPAYVILMGSDNVVDNKLFDVACRYMAKGYDFFGVKDLYYLNSANNTMVYSRGYINHRAGEAVGGFKVLSNKILTYLKWKPANPRKNKNFDGYLASKLKNLKSSKKIVVSLRDIDAFLIDIKSDTNINKFKIRDNQTLVKASEVLKKYLPENEVKMML